jgi:hypothetical protein
MQSQDSKDANTFDYNAEEDVKASVTNFRKVLEKDLDSLKDERYMLEVVHDSFERVKDCLRILPAPDSVEFEHARETLSRYPSLMTFAAQIKDRIQDILDDDTPEADRTTTEYSRVLLSNKTLFENTRDCLQAFLNDK